MDSPTTTSARELGTAARDQGRWDEALAHFEAAAAAQPEELVFQVEIAHTLRDMGRYEEAEQRYSRICEQLAPHGGPVHAAWGRSLRRRGRYAEALEKFRFAVARNPDNIAAALDVARTLKDLGRLDESIRECQGVVARAPDHVAAKMLLARLQIDSGDRPAALGTFEAIADANPGDRSVRLEIAGLCLGLGRPDLAEARCREILALDARDTRALVLLGQSQVDSGRAELAQTSFEAALAVTPTDDEALLHLGALLLQQSRLHEARERYLGVSARSPRYAAALRGLIRIARASGDAPLAAEYAASAAQADARIGGSRAVTLAPFNWKAKIAEARLAVQATAAPVRVRLQACATLLDYGVTGELDPVLQSLAQRSRTARKLQARVKRLRRLGLVDECRGTPDEVERFRGYVDHRLAGASTLVVTFGGCRRGFYTAVDLLHNALRDTGASVIHLRDLERALYLRGIVGLGQGYVGAIEGLSRLAAESGARRVLTLGTGVGAAGALRYGLDLGAEAVLALSPRSRVRTASISDPNGIAKIEALRALEPRITQDPRSLYLASERRPGVTVVYTGEHREDAEDLAAVPGVTLAPMPNEAGDCMTLLLERGLLKPVIHDFVDDGAVDAALLQRIRETA